MANDLFFHRATLAMVTTGLGMICWIALHLPWDRSRAHGRAEGRADRQREICPACASCPGCPQTGRGTPGEKLSLDMDLACRTIATRYALSEREREILPYLLRGHKALSIAHTLDMSESSVRTRGGCTASWASARATGCSDWLRPRPPCPRRRRRSSGAARKRREDAPLDEMAPKTKRGPVGDRASQGGMRRIFIKG